MLNSVQMDFVLIPAVMTNGWNGGNWPGGYVSEYEVTVKQFTNARKAECLWRCYGWSVTKVSVNGAMAFCLALTEMERKAGNLRSGWEYRLPTWKEWCGFAGPPSKTHSRGLQAVYGGVWELAIGNRGYSKDSRMGLSGRVAEINTNMPGYRYEEPFSTSASETDTGFQAILVPVQ